MPPEIRLKVRNALNSNLDLIESFVDENPGDFLEEELRIVHSWRYLITGQFYVFRSLKKYTVFLSMTDPAIAYGVLALSQPFDDLIGPNLPTMIETVLLPFKDKIIYDGLMNRYSISFGPGMRRILNENYKAAKAGQGIMTHLHSGKF